LNDAPERERQEFGIDLTEVRHEPVASRRRLRLYVAAMVVFPFALVALMLWWMTTDNFLERTQYAFLIGTGYGSTLKNADCDVLVDGDSSALVGVMPEVIEQRTGLKTCNIADVAGVKLVNGMMVLDDYLAHNKRPRILLFVFAPENLTPPKEWVSVSDFEGILYRMRFHRDAGFWHLALFQPNRIISTAELGFRTEFPRIFSKPLPYEVAHERRLSGGRIAIPGAGLTRCLSDAIEREPDAAWLEHLREAYGVDGTRVLVDVTPEPPCDASLEYYETRLNGSLIDNRMETLPLKDYTASGRLHTTNEGARAFSGRLAEQIGAVSAANGRGGR
jgi:hypothetical protein